MFYRGIQSYFFFSNYLFITCDQIFVISKRKL